MVYTKAILKIYAVYCRGIISDVCQDYAKKPILLIADEPCGCPALGQESFSAQEQVLPVWQEIFDQLRRPAFFGL